MVEINSGAYFLSGAVERCHTANQALAVKCGRLSLIEAERSFSSTPSPSVLEVTHEVTAAGPLRALGGSHLDAWNGKILSDTVQALWIERPDKEEQELGVAAAVAGLFGIAPKDELEGMIAAQLLAAHNAVMECHRRSMLGEQTFEGRRENLSQANKLSRTFATLLEALNRYRGKGQQKVTVEHVHVHAGGQAVVGTVAIPGVGIDRNRRINPMQSRLPMHRSPRCGARTRNGSRCQSPAMPNSRCRMHGGMSPGAPKGNKNAFKHGR
jgi:hypothetical protein